MSRLIEQLRASDYPDKSPRDLTLEYGEWLEAQGRKDIFLANPDFAAEYEAIRDEIARARRPSYVEEFKGAFGSAVDDLQATGYGLGALAAHGAKGLGIPGAEPIRNNLLRLMKEQQDEAAQYQPSVPSYDKITNAEDLGRYATYGLGTVAPSMVQAAASGVAGAAIGSAVGPGGTVGGALLGLAEKRLAQKVLSGWLAKGITSESLEVAAQTLTKKEIADEAKRLAMQYGGQAALAASSIGQEVGSIYGENPEAPGTALAYGIPAGLLDVLPDAYIASRFLGAGRRVAEAEVKQSVGYFRRFAQEAAKIVPLEGSTEAAQTLLEIAAAKSGRGEDPWTFTDQDYKHMLNAGLIGAIGGLGMAPVSAIGNPDARMDPTAQLTSDAMVERLPARQNAETPGAMDFGQGNDLLEGDLGLLETPGPGLPLAPLRGDAMAGIGEVETPDADFDPFARARPAFRSAEVFAQNDEDLSLERGVLYGEQPSTEASFGAGFGGASEAGRRGVTPQPQAPQPPGGPGAPAEVAPVAPVAPAAPPVEPSKAVTKTVANVQEALAAVETAQTGVEPPAVVLPTPAVASPPNETPQKNKSDVTIGGLDAVIANGQGQITVQHRGVEVPFDQFVVSVNENEAEVGFVRIKDRGDASKGIGTLAYIRLGEELAKRGITLRSSGAQYAPGNALWARLGKMGYAVRKGNGWAFSNVAAQAPAPAPAPTVNDSLTVEPPVAPVSKAPMPVVEAEEPAAPMTALQTWRGTVREVPKPASWGGAPGETLFIPVDASGNDVTVGGQTILAKTAEEAVRLAQTNVTAEPTPAALAAPSDEGSPVEETPAATVTKAANSEPAKLPNAYSSDEWDLLIENLADSADTFSFARGSGRANYELKDLASEFGDFAKANGGIPMSESFKLFRRESVASKQKLSQLSTLLKEAGLIEKAANAGPLAAAPANRVSVNPSTDELLGTNERGEPIYWSSDAKTHYAVSDGKVRTAPWTEGLPASAMQRLDELISTATETPAPAAPAPAAAAPTLTRDQVADAARERGNNDPSLPPAPPDAYETLKALSKQRNRSGYNPDMLTPERLKVAVDAGFITKGKTPSFTEKGRNQLQDWEQMAKDRGQAAAGLSDQYVDEAVSKWDRENDPNSWEGKNRAALPVIQPTGVVTQPTVEQVIQKGDNGVKPLPRDSAPNLKRLQVFTQPRAPIVVEGQENEPASIRPVESAALGPNPMVELVKRVKKAIKEGSNVVAVIVDNQTGQAFQRLAYGGPSNTVYIDMASSREPNKKSYGTIQGSTTSAKADFLNGTEGRPISGQRGIFAETMPNGMPRYTVYGIGELTKPGKLANWNLGTVAGLAQHPGITEAAKRGWTEQAQAVNSAKDEMPTVPKFKNAAEESGEALLRFSDEMAAWSSRHRSAADKAKARVRIDEFAAAVAKALGDTANAKAYAEAIKQQINLKSDIALKQAVLISDDYTAPTAATNYLFRSTLRALTEGRKVDVAAFEQGLFGALDAASQTTGLVINGANRRPIVAFAASAINGPVRPDTVLSLLHEVGHVITDGLPEPLRVAFQESINDMPWQQAFYDRSRGAAESGLRTTTRAPWMVQEDASRPYGFFVGPDGTMHPVDMMLHEFAAKKLLGDRYVSGNGTYEYQLGKLGFARAVMDRGSNTMLFDLRAPLTRLQKQAIKDWAIESETNAVFGKDTSISGGGRKEEIHRVDDKIMLTQRASSTQPLRLRRPMEALERMARENESWRDWYSEFQGELDRFFGPDAALFQKLLAVTSQNTTVNGNVTLALKAYVQFKNGEKFTGYLPAVSMNLEAVRADEQVGGRKIGNFTRATGGDESAITADRHIAQLFFGVSAPTRAQYQKAEQIIRELAKKLGWTPAQVQASLWAANIRRNGKEPATYHDYLKRLEEDGRLAGWLNQIRGNDSGAGGEGRPAFDGSLEDGEAVEEGDIRLTVRTEAGAEPTGPAFYSRLTRTVEQSPQGKASGAQWKATIRNSKLGVNADEFALVGVGDLEDAKTYTKQEVLDYLRANEVVVEDVTLGAAGSKLTVLSWEQATDNLLTATLPNGNSATIFYEAENAAAGASLSVLTPDAVDVSSERNFPSVEEAKVAALEFVRSEGQDNETSFSSYTLPGAVEGSYREVLLTVPETKNAVQPTEADVLAQAKVDAKGHEENWEGLSEHTKRQYRMAVRQRWIDANSGWQDGHGQYSSIKNPIVRLRLNERTTADGKRMLFLEEVQAPQKGEFEKMPALFQKNWREIAFKWALRHAAENGFDSVGWTTGEQQAERYSLEKQVRGIEWTPIRNTNTGVTHVIVDTPSGLTRFNVNREGMVSFEGANSAGLEGKALSDVLGKDVAAKIMGASEGKLSGDGLKIGGEGLKKLYDSDFRNVVNGLPVVKKSGQKVGTAEIGTPKNGKPTDSLSDGELLQELNRFKDSDTVNSLTLTPAIRDAVMGGQARFTVRTPSSGAGWLMNPRSLDIRLLANADPAQLSPQQRAALERLTPEEIAAARRIDPAVLLEEKMAEHLAQLGWDKSEAKGAVQAMIRFVKELWYKMSIAIQTALKGAENISPTLARAYAENRYLQFIHRDSALASDRINDLMNWLGVPAKDSQKIPVFPAGADWDQRMTYIDVATGEIIPVKTGNYTPDAQTRELKLSLDRAAKWVAEHPAGSTPDTSDLRFTQRANFSAPFSSTPTITLNGQFARINLEDELYRKIAADSEIAPLLPIRDGEPPSAQAFATDWLKIPSEQTPEARRRQAAESASQPDPLTGQPIAHQPDITIDALPTVEQQITDRDGKPRTVQITEAQDDAIKQALLSMRDTYRRVTAQLARDQARYDELTAQKAKEGRTRGEFSAAAQYELSSLGEKVLLRQRIALRLDREINALLAKFQPGDIVQVFPGAEMLSVPTPDASEEQIRSARKYKLPLQFAFATSEERSNIGDEITRGEAWLKNPENRLQGQIYGIVSEQVRKLRQIPLDQERSAVSVILRKLSGGFIGNLNAIGLPSTRLMAKRFAGVNAFVNQYRSDLTVLGHKWETAFGRFAEAVGRPSDASFVEEMWDPLSRIWNFIDSSERAKLGTGGEASIFAAMERELKAQTGFEVKGEKQRAALRALLMQSIERERYFGKIFEQHPELKVYDKELKSYRRLFTHGMVTGSRGLRREMGALALRMNPLWSDTTGIGRDDVRTFWQAAGDLYGQNREDFDSRMAKLFDGYVAEDFVAPLANNNTPIFSVIGSDGQSRPAGILNVRRAWSEAGNDVTRFAEILHQLEAAPDGMEGQTVGLVLGSLRERFGALKSILDKQAAAANSGVETLQRQMLDGREANDLPAQWVSYATMDHISNLTLLHQLGMQSAFGPEGLNSAKSSAFGDRRSADGADQLSAGGELAETVMAAKRELTDIRGRFDVLMRDGQSPKQIETQMGYDDFNIAKNYDRSVADLNRVETLFNQMRSVTNYLNTDLKAANDLLGLASTMMLQNPRSGVQQVADILGMIVDLKMSTQTLRGLRSAVKTTAGQIANSVLESFGQQAAFGVDAAQRRLRIGARDSETRVGWTEKTQGMGPRNQLGVPVGYEAKGDFIGRTISRVSRRARDIVPAAGSPLARPGDDRLGPKLTAGVFHTFTRAAMDANATAAYDLFADIAGRGVEFLQRIPAKDRAQFVRELELGIRDLGADELGYYGGFILNDRAAFDSLKAGLETQMAGERSVGDFVAKAYRRMETAQNEAEAGRGDGAWDVVSDSQFVDIANYAASQWTLQPNFATLPSFMQGPWRPLFIFITWPYLAMRRAAAGFTDAQQRMTWAGANSSVADGAKAFFLVAAPATIAGSFAIDWYDEYILGKRQNLRNAPASTAIPLLGAALHPAAFVERWARYGTAGLPSDILNMAVNYDSQRGLSLDNRVVAFNAIGGLFNTLIKTPIQTEANLTYAAFGRPLMQSIGGGGVLHYLQVAQNLLGLNTQDAAINARINTGNYLRAAGKELNLPVAIFTAPVAIPTPISPYLQQMELAALVNNADLFRSAYRSAVQAARDSGHREDAEKYVANNFSERHPLKRLFKGAVSESDYRKMLGEMGEYGAGKVRESINSYNRYLNNWFGKKAYYGKADRGGGESVEELIRRASRINYELDQTNDAQLAIR